MTSLTAFILLILGCPAVVMGAEAEEIGLVFADYQQLMAQKIAWRGDKPKAYQSLIADADRALEERLATVMDKRRTAPSGDKHDYLSLAPYWWPDPNTADGLPYIRRDGRVNPTTRGEYVDYPAKQRFFHRVHTLGMAAFYTEDLRYARKAVSLLEAWFADPETRMSPHLEYAQGVPGRSDGRGYGIIEWCDIDKLITPIQLLRASDSIPEPTYRAIVNWI